MSKRKYSKGDKFEIDQASIIATGTIVYTDADFAIARIESSSDEAMEIIGSCPFSANFISQLDHFEADRELLAHEVYMVICNDEE
jgi:hypothetical protein